nr:hypothetical protein [Segatella maculosa]
MQNTDWFKLLTRDSFSQDHSINLSGGADKFRYYASLGYTNDNDVINRNGNDRYTRPQILTSRSTTNSN